MIRADFHVHTTFCDGVNTAEEMVLVALERQMDAIGFSTHSYTFFDESYCIKKERIGEYRSEIGRLQEKYGHRIRILCGIEQDYYSDMPLEGYDFAIGSVHYLKKGDRYLPLDESRAQLTAFTEQYYGGDFYAMASDYYATLADLPSKGITVVGHADLITKFNAGSALFDESDPRYRAAALGAVDRLLQFGLPFEINTGAMSRGYRDCPYPAAFLIDHIAGHGGRFLLSGDAHAAKDLCFEFDKICAKYPHLRLITLPTKD